MLPREVREGAELVSDWVKGEVAFLRDTKQFGGSVVMLVLVGEVLEYFLRVTGERGERAEGQ